MHPGRAVKHRLDLAVCHVLQHVGMEVVHSRTMEGEVSDVAMPRTLIVRSSKIAPQNPGPILRLCAVYCTFSFHVNQVSILLHRLKQTPCKPSLHFILHFHVRLLITYIVNWGIFKNAAMAVKRLCSILLVVSLAVVARATCPAHCTATSNNAVWPCRYHSNGCQVGGAQQGPHIPLQFLYMFRVVLCCETPGDSGG